MTIPLSSSLPCEVGRNASRLGEVNFDFADKKTGYRTHALHPYPAKFIPQIPELLIRELSGEGETVADVFCGSGTTLVEALVLGRKAVGFDANPLACLISRAKTTRLSEAEISNLRLLANEASEHAQSIASASEGSDGNVFLSDAPRPDGHVLEFWFDRAVVEELAEVLSWCNALPTEPARTVALVSFSSIVVSVSKQDSDTRYVRREKNLAAGGTTSKFARALRAAVDAIERFQAEVPPETQCEIIEGSVLDRPHCPPLDLMVCSPPYPNAFSYHLYHMTRMIWMGMNQPKFKREEIGSHRKYSSKGPNGATAATFQTEMRTILNWLRSHLKIGGYACFVVGDSTIRGERVDNAELISTVGRLEGFCEIARPSRRLQASKKSFNPAIGRIKDEKILILENLGRPTE